MPINPARKSACLPLNLNQCSFLVSPGSLSDSVSSAFSTTVHFLLPQWHIPNFGSNVDTQIIRPQPVMQLMKTTIKTTLCLCVNVCASEVFWALASEVGKEGLMAAVRAGLAGMWGILCDKGLPLIVAVACGASSVPVGAPSTTIDFKVSCTGVRSLGLVSLCPNAQKTSLYAGFRSLRKLLTFRWYSKGIGCILR